MKRRLLIGSAALVLCSTLVTAQDAPESLLPPGFDDPAPEPAPTNTQAPAQTSAPAQSTAPSAPSGAVAPPPVSTGPAAPALPQALPGGLPSIAELEELGTDELDELLGLKPKYDIPRAARRSLTQVGIIGANEGGLPSVALANQPANLVRASLDGIKGPLVSRWGHILMRRALASRLDAPSGMNPVDFAALRARALNRIGEHAAARAIVQDVDTGNWNEAMLDAALDAYVGTGDIVGACPAAQVKSDLRDDTQWDLVKNICYAFSGQGSRAQSNLNRVLRGDEVADIDVLLAQRFAGAAGLGRRAVNLEWDGVEQMTPWRFALANALGAELPEALGDNLSPYYLNISATAPMLSIERRVEGADVAARRGVLSSSAMIDLYSMLAAQGQATSAATQIADQLRNAYVAQDPQARLAAIRAIWGEDSRDYARFVLTAFAAARITPNAEMEDDAADLIASMLSAGLDADALSWAQFVPQGSEAWALLVLAQPTRSNPVTEGQVDSFVDDDESKDQAKSKFFVAGLAGLGRLDPAARQSLSESLAIDLQSSSKWTTLISQAADVNNPVLVAYLAGLGMQGNGWDKMTARHLFHIVSALNRVGLSAEARMIAAEAVARG